MKIDVELMSRILDEIEARDGEHRGDERFTDETMAAATGFENVAEVHDFCAEQAIQFPIPRSTDEYYSCVAIAALTFFQLGVEYRTKEGNGTSKTTTD